MKIEYFKFILEVYKTKNITTAAKNLYTSQPHLSQGIKKIENHLGLKIFERSRSGTFPTDIGYEVIAQMQEIVNNLENLEHKYDPTKITNLKATLSIATIPTLSMSLLPRTISSFKKKYPKIDFRIEEDHSFNIIEKVKKNKYDLGFIAISDEKFIENELLFTYITSTKIKACVSSKNPLAERNEIELSEIVNYPILSSSSFVINTLKEYGEPKFLFQSKEIEGAKRAISEDLAIGFYTDLSLQFDPYVFTNQIIPLDIKHNLFNLSLYLIERNKIDRVLNNKFKEDFFVQLKAHSNLMDS